MKGDFHDIPDHIHQADGLLITAGAGMGVDSGLPDFRGEEGFWRAYPALRQSSINFYDIASPDAFCDDPTQAWGFYGHRLNLYRKAVPHLGFKILLGLAREMPNGAFIFTSNVDGQFQKAGFSEAQIVECHGSIQHMQCLYGCMNDVWSAEEFIPVTNDAICQLTSQLPSCPYCGELARPNILMFNDWKWVSYRMKQQEARLEKWLNRIRRLLIIEIGAGTSIPTVRRFSEGQGGYVIRINPDEPELPSHVKGISLRMGGLNGLRLIADAMKPDEQEVSV